MAFTSFISEFYPQQVKSNKEDSATLANHAREITPKLFAALKPRDDLHSLQPSIMSFVK
jgi:hypothetical protein